MTVRRGILTGAIAAAWLLPVAVRGDVDPTQRNYIMRARPGVSITEGELSESQLYDGHTQITLSYFDGLGRPTGQCELGAGGSGEDIFTYVEYDRRGLEYRRWQPVPF